ncbi:MAG: hypothetical protein LBF88_12670 [Planctomycetaceae bacterium]|jgi:uncharacterized membrane-anchored protein YjiN (DUF445 family)|nr:hypothetical protein [Planctomycetaceae bacterium]
MDTLRTIVNSERLTAIIDLPVELQNREVEIIILPVKEEPAKSERTTTKSLEFSEEDMERFRLNGEKLMDEIKEKRKHKPKMSREKFLELLLQCPVADEETINRQDEIRQELQKWRIE